jgi:hypothetical protein
MANVYTPGLKVTRRIRLTRERRLPLKGEVVVGKGDRVEANQVVARTDLPGNVHMVNVAGLLNVHQSDVSEAMLKKVGESVAKDEQLAMSKGLFGLFKSYCKAPVAGEIESVSDVTGQVVLREPPIPVEVHAYVDGVVTDIYPEEGVEVTCDAAFVQGIFGIGGEVSGTLHMLAKSPDDLISPDQLTPDLKGKVVVVGKLASAELLRRAAELGLSAIVAGGIHAQELKEFLGYDLGVAITGSEDRGITLITTEGFGPLVMADKTFALLKSNEGKRACANGATQIRAGVMRPEILIPDAAAGDDAPQAQMGKGIVVGSTVRVIRAPYFGELGEVTELPPKLEQMESETMVRVLRARLRSGDLVTVPRANVEMIEEV